MTPAELTAAGQTVFGWRWVSAMARELHLSRRTVCYYRDGERRIPAARAEEIRRLANLGPVGDLIRRSIGKAAPDLPQVRWHRIAVRVLEDLTAAGFVQRDIGPNDRAGQSAGSPPKDR